MISDYLNEKFCVMNLSSGGKEDSIKEIAAVLAGEGKLSDKETFISDVLERESLGSTGIGNNVAIPHARTSAVKGFVIGFGRSLEGINFESLDGEKVNFIFLMGADPNELNLYLRLLAELSRLLMDASFRQELIASKTGKEIIEVIRKFEKG